MICCLFGSHAQRRKSISPKPPPTAAQNQAQHDTVRSCSESQKSTEIVVDRDVVQDVAKRDDSILIRVMGTTGFEHPHQNSTDPPLSHENGAKSGVLVLNDHVLVALVEAWPTLPEPIKAAVRALVESVRHEPR